MSNAVERANTFRRRYVATIGVTAAACGLLALRAKSPSRALAVFGASIGGSALFAAAAWPATKKVVTDVAAEKVTEEVARLGASIFK